MISVNGRDIADCFTDGPSTTVVEEYVDCHYAEVLIYANLVAGICRAGAIAGIDPVAHYVPFEQRSCGIPSSGR
jgi:hypothetical protein